ncbi:MAG: glycosyltransferase family 4 protein [Bacteroidales bacterium]|nr:glycosyltransferase family 4 protein [Bacteroidales bacterium]
MNIAYFITSTANAGPINVVLDLVKVMVLHGHQCSVFYFKNKSEDKRFSSHCYCQRINLLTNIDLSEFDVVHSHGLMPDLYLFMHLPLCTKKRPKYFSTIHSFIFEDHKYLYGPLKSFFTSRLTIAATCRADKVIVLGHTAISHFRGHIKANRLTWAYNTRVIENIDDIDPNDIDLIKNFKSKFKFTIGCICAFNKRKGIEQIIKALPQMPEVGLILVGDGEIISHLREFAFEINVLDNILFIGRRSDGFRYLNYVDIFCMPSRSEGFPLSLLEAAILKKTCVISDIPVFKEIFSDEEVSFFRLDDINDLTHKIRHAWENKEVLGAAIRLKYDNCYAPERFYQRHLKIYSN